MSSLFALKYLLLKPVYTLYGHIPEYLGPDPQSFRKMPAEDMREFWKDGLKHFFKRIGKEKVEFCCLGKGKAASVSH